LSNIVKRSLSGAVFVAVVTGSILLGAYSCAVMLLVVIIWSMHEFYTIIAKDHVRTGTFTGLLVGVTVFAACFFYAQGEDYISDCLFLCLFPLVVLLFISRLYYKNNNSFRSIAYVLTGVVYISLPFSLFNFLMFPSGEAYKPDIMLGFFILLWANDTFAYLTGILFGKHRLFKRISPKKSWEGFFGGLICTVSLSLLINKFFALPTPQWMTWGGLHWMVISAIIVVFGVYGDLTESLLKRNFKIKDSGRFLPGHGGILDRFDSVMLSVPVVFFYLKLFVYK